MHLFNTAEAIVCNCMLLAGSQCLAKDDYTGKHQARPRISGYVKQSAEATDKTIFMQHA